MLTLKRRGTYWQIVGTLPNGRRIRQSTGTADKSLAERIMAKDYAHLIEQAHGLTPRSAYGLTLQEAYDLTWQTRQEWLDAKGPQTIRFNWAHVRDFFGASREVKSITQDDADAFAAHQRAIAAPSTVNSRLGVLSVVLETARARGAVSGVRKVPSVKRTKGRIRVITGEEEARILEWFNENAEPRMAHFVVWQVETGMRLSETLNLRPQDIDADARLVRVWENKADLPRSVPLTDRVLSILGRHTMPPKELTKDRAEHLWQKMRLALDLQDDPEFVIHALRHTCASRILRRTGNIELCRQWLGHKDIKTTQGYAHLHPQALLDAAKLMSSECVESVPVPPKKRLRVVR